MSPLVVQVEAPAVVHLTVLWQLEEVFVDWEAAQVQGEGFA